MLVPPHWIGKATTNKVERRARFADISSTIFDMFKAEQWNNMVDLGLGEASIASDVFIRLVVDIKKELLVDVGRAVRVLLGHLAGDDLLLLVVAGVQEACHNDECFFIL